MTRLRPKHVIAAVLCIWGMLYLLSTISDVFKNYILPAFPLILLVAVAMLIILPPSLYRYLGNMVGILMKYVKPVFRNRSPQPVKSKFEEEQSYEQGYQAFSSNMASQFSDTPQAQYPEMPQVYSPLILDSNSSMQHPPQARD